MLVGDVWVASGQSNMELRLRDALNGPGEIVVSHYPRSASFRLRIKPRPIRWITSTPARDGWSLRRIPPAAFPQSPTSSRGLQKSVNGVPIGLLSSSGWRTPQRASVSLKTISADASLMPVFSLWARMNEDTVAEKLRREIQLKAWQDAVNQAKAEGKPGPGVYTKPTAMAKWGPAGFCARTP